MRPLRSSPSLWRRVSALASAIALVAACVAGARAQDELAKARETVSRAETAFRNFMADPDHGAFRANLPRANAVLIVPQLGKGGFIVGGSGGAGVLVGKDRMSGTWSQPAFYSFFSGSFGLQIGFQVAEVVLLAMTERGFDALLSTKLQLGADASVAAGPVGVGGQAATTDILAFARGKGLFGGLTVEGGVITPNHARNKAYYGREASPPDILVTRRVYNAHADALVNAVTDGARRR